jgi:hypothetical protein
MQNKRYIPIIAILSLVFAIGPIGCASTTQITSEPSAATVRVDNVVLGDTPATYSEGSVWVWTNRRVTVEKKGYQQVNGAIKGEIVPINIVIGILCCLPFVLVGEFRPQHHFVLNRKQALETAQNFVEQVQIQFAN